jgi:hypothetical protein
MSLTYEKIEARAYGLYLARNEKDGSPLEDWLKAEKEIKTGALVRNEKKHHNKNKK